MKDSDSIVSRGETNIVVLLLPTHVVYEESALERTSHDTARVLAIDIGGIARLRNSVQPTLGLHGPLLESDL